MENVTDWDQVLNELPDDAADVVLGVLGSTPEQRVGRAQWMIKVVEDDLEAAVRDAREAGTSWAEIGSWFGITRQSAHERFAASIRTALSLRDGVPSLQDWLPEDTEERLV